MATKKRRTGPEVDWLDVLAGFALVTLALLMLCECAPTLPPEPPITITDTCRVDAGLPALVP